jgi:hypothetical protein
MNLDDGETNPVNELVNDLKSRLFRAENALKEKS